MQRFNPPNGAHLSESSSSDTRTFGDPTGQSQNSGQTSRRERFCAVAKIHLATNFFWQVLTSFTPFASWRISPQTICFLTLRTAITRFDPSLVRVASILFLSG
jgi:hypothetical protein